MICENCQNSEAYHSRIVYEDGERHQCCDRCETAPIGGTWIADVYWPKSGAYHSDALDVDFTSRAQKAQYLRENGLSEAGDLKFGQKTWVEGSRDARRAQFAQERPKLQKIYRDWLNRRRP